MIERDIRGERDKRFYILEKNQMEIIYLSKTDSLHYFRAQVVTVFTVLKNLLARHYNNDIPTSQ